MKKPQLREKYLKLRLRMTAEEIEEQSLLIANKLLELRIWDLNFYHLFLTITEKKEIDTEPILHILQGKDKNIVLSRCNVNTGTLHNFLLTDNTIIKKNKWNIPEPVNGVEVPSEQIDVVFVPLMAYDKEGNRIGYGKGFYDNFLATCRENVIKIGLSFFDPEPHISEVYASDIALDFCVTPTQIFHFQKKKGEK
ncbi:MAG TPA: 5-formyltetrahydrofolate cyclo-ligase [Salinimicrobium sp.]|nr:5-formyltetrahydrofolate cyclo-ligase [Salinimicrobium sp.]